MLNFLLWNILKNYIIKDGLTGNPFLTQGKENIFSTHSLKNEESQTYLRNECLCKAMVDFNMIDTVSRGIKKMFNEQWHRHFPLPDYEIDAAKKKVVVRIYGNEINKRYTDLLKTDNTLSL